MRPSYLIAVSLAASVTLSPALAVAADVNAKAAQAQTAPPVITPIPGASALPAADGEKAGCGAVLVILGKVADGYPEMFANQANGKMIQTLLSALGLKGKAMMDDAFAEGAAKGLSPSQTYEAGVVGLLASVKSDVAGGSAQDAGKKAGVALMKRCTGMGE
jgi:hypothetical protein